MRAIDRIAALLVATIATACSTGPSEPMGDTTPRAERPLLTTLTTVPGFTQTAMSTRFQMGGAVTNVLQSGFTKWVGLNGVFSVDNTNGAAAGIMNAGVPFSPYAGSIASHEALVQSYFLAAGLPANQAGAIRTNVTQSGDGKPGDPEIPTETSFSSIITRSVSGILVAESHAWARLDSGGNVVAENVYWPPLDASVVNDAAALSATISDPVQAAGYLGKLPFASSISATGSVVIHHSSEFTREAFQDVACYDVWNASPLGSGWVRHFDKNGAEVRLPQEQRVGTPSVRM
jgi:hypothetical protein